MFLIPALVRYVMRVWRRRKAAREGRADGGSS
jgi:hypothetical protein